MNHGCKIIFLLFEDKKLYWPRLQEIIGACEKSVNRDEYRKLFWKTNFH